MYIFSATNIIAHAPIARISLSLSLSTVSKFDKFTKFYFAKHDFVVNSPNFSPTKVSLHIQYNKSEQKYLHCLKNPIVTS